MLIRPATMEDLDAIAQVEALCFPAAEAATAAEFRDRITYYGNHFSLLFDDQNRLVSFVDGFATNTPDLTDEMYEKADLHEEDGAWQMIFGVNTIPECRKKGFAAQVLHHVIETARQEGRLGLVLTCKEALIHYYAKFGFINEGISQSVHGNVVWYQMRLTF